MSTGISCCRFEIMVVVAVNLLWLYVLAYMYENCMYIVYDISLSGKKIVMDIV